MEFTVEEINDFLEKSYFYNIKIDIFKLPNFLKKSKLYDEKYKDILNNNYHKIIKDQIFPYMSFNVDNFIAAPNESLLIDSKVDENGNFQNLYVKWGDANVAIFKKGSDITTLFLNQS